MTGTCEFLSSNGVKRIISGKMTLTGKGGEGRFSVKYDTFPLGYDAALVVLDTDYKNYAVIWSCSNIGPIGHTESAWVSRTWIKRAALISMQSQLMARERIPRGEVLQAAYGVLDKYKMNRSFFIKTEQTSCETLPPPLEAIDPTSTEANEAKKVDEKENETVVVSENIADSDEIIETTTITDAISEPTTIKVWKFV